MNNLKIFLVVISLLFAHFVHAQSRFPKINVDNVQIDGNTISSTTGNLILDPTGELVFTDLTGNRVPYLNSNKEVKASLIDQTELERLDGIGSSVCGISDACIFTNKDIDGGTAANSRRITVPSNTKTNLNSLTRKAGSLLWASDESKLYVDNGTTLQEAGGTATTLKGQSEVSPVLTSAFQVPYNQATTTTTDTRRIETGNGNLLKDPSFESSTCKDGWTVYTSGGITSSGCYTGSFKDGTKSYLVQDSNPVTSGTKFFTQTVSLGNLSLQNQSIFASIWLKPELSGGSLSQISVCVGNGTTDLQCQSPTIDNQWQQMYFSVSPGSATSLEFYAKSTNSSLSLWSIAWDGAYLGSMPALGLGSVPIVTDWTDGGAITITATTTAPTKPTGIVVDKFWYRYVGGDLEARLEYKQSNTTSANVGSGDYLIALPTSAGCTIDTTKTTTYTTVVGYNAVAFSPSNVGSSWFGNNASNASGGVSVYSTTQVRLPILVSDTSNGNTIGMFSSGYSLFTANANNSFGASFKVPCQGRSVNQAAVQLSQANTGWTNYAATGSGFTFTIANAQDCRYRLNGPMLDFKCKGTISSVAGSEARISIPYTSVSSSLMASIEYAGNIEASGSSTTYFGACAMREPGVSYITIGQRTSTGHCGTKVNGSAFSNSTVLDITASIPIAGRENAPGNIGTITGMVSSGNCSNCVLYAATITNPSGTCAIGSQSSNWIASATNAGSGQCNLVWAANTFSAKPWCTCTAEGSGTGSCNIQVPTTTSGGGFVTRNAAGTSSNNDFSIQCMGPR